LPIVPMLIFSIFSFFAGVLVIFLPETCDRPLPDTLQDAVTFLRSDPRYQCYSFGANKSSSLMLREENENVAAGGAAGADVADDRRSIASSGTRSRRISTVSGGTERRPSIAVLQEARVNFF
uniref:MFS domain-containing protein n=1 Tax=Gongylonema pulchrum TaxID=637853 RepID=A0A183DL00_9BILA